MYVSSTIIFVAALSRVALALPQYGSRIERDSGSYMGRRVAAREAAPLQDIPQYVLDYAPLVHLHSEERYWPSDLGEHLAHTTPFLNYTALPEDEWHPTLDTLGLFNKYDGGMFVYLHSNDDVENDPDWITSEYGIPGTDATKLKATTPEMSHEGGRSRGTPPANETEPGRRSAAPAVLIVVEKDDGIVDAFWFFFYSYNLGNTFFGIRFGNHVGDWEHFCLRFQHGMPKESFFSEHAWGSAFTYDALEKKEDRPLIFSGSGTHAMYSTPGIQSYILPFSILHDKTDRGPLWDPAQNLYAYNYKILPNATVESNSNLPPNQFIPSSLSLQAPTSFLTYAGAWGDKQYPKSDKRQYGVPFLPDKHYVNGPRGPLLKDLERAKVCPYEKCDVKDSIKGRALVLWILFDWVAGCLLFWPLFGLGLAFYSVSKWVARIWNGAWKGKKTFEDVAEGETEPSLLDEALSNTVNVSERTPLLANGIAP